jgi:NAD(P)H dehydrogenase (quinone)
MDEMTIVITGAGGKLGSLLIDQLLQNVPPHQIAACVRRPEAGERYEKQGVSVRHCDYDDPATLEQAFAGASQLLLISSSHQDDSIRLRQHLNVIEAAKKSNVKRLLYTSFAFLERGSGPPIPLHLATEEAIRAAGIPYVILRNALYIDFVGVLDLPSAISTGRLTIPPGEWRFNSVSRQDLAYASAILLSDVGMTNQVYELTASSSWSFEDLSVALSSLTGKSITVNRDPSIQNWIFKFLRSMDTSSTSHDLERLLRHPVTTLSDSIKPFITSL